MPDGDQLAVVRNGLGLISEIYGWYPGTDKPLSVKAAGRTGVFITDPQLGATVLGVADVAGGALIKNYTSLTAWGEIAGDTVGTPRLRMAGQQYDPQTGLYYMRARFYDPVLGRFISEDPIGAGSGMNLYAYAGNDPVNLRDPSGLDYRWTDEGYCEEWADVTFHYDTRTGDVWGHTINDTWSVCVPGTQPGAGEGRSGSSSGSAQITTSSRDASADDKCLTLGLNLLANGTLDGLSWAALFSGGGLLLQGGRLLLRGTVRQGVAGFVNGGVIAIGRGGIVTTVRSEGRRLLQRGAADIMEGTVTAAGGAGLVVASYADDAARGGLRPNSLWDLIPGSGTVSAFREFYQACVRR